MSLIVEDGSVVPNANAYCSVSFATTYHGMRGNGDAWDAIEDKEAAIVKATDYMTQTLRARWKGARWKQEQALDWPRTDVEIDDLAYGFLLDVNVVPLPVQQACAELALRTASSALAPDVARGKSHVTVGPISVTYDTADPQTKRFAAVNGLLAPYLRGTSGMARLIPT